MKPFDRHNENLTCQFEHIRWEDGLSEEKLQEAYERLMENEQGVSKAMLKAKTFELIANQSRIAIDQDDIFQDKLFSGNLLHRQRGNWEKQAVEEHLAEEARKISEAWNECGAYTGASDYGHTSPNSRLLLEIGFTGLIERLKKAASREGLSEKQKDFYAAGIVNLKALLTYLSRLAEAIAPYQKENAQTLWNLTKGAPGTIYEAMQALIAYFFFHEYVGGTRVRTLGRLDVLLQPFYERDLKNGTFTKAEIKEMLKFFLNKFWSAKVPFDLPLCLGGLDEEGNEVTNEMSYLIVETYNELDIYSPKIHIRVSDRTPESFVKLVLSCIRGGNSSFVFINDEVCVKGLKAVGIEEKDAWNYVPIGCYEPAVWGVEIGCTGNGGVNLAKAVEWVVTGGKDWKSGKPIGLDTGSIETYEDFVRAVKAQIRFMTEQAMEYVVKIEKLYGEINPDLILSAMYDESVERGVDVYEGGAKYNNSSLYFYFIATLVDSMLAVKKLVFEEKRVSFEELCEILKNNWQGQEKLRAIIRRIPEKYGNGCPAADRLAREMTDFCAELVNNRPNGRGGVFKAACFSIDRAFTLAPKTMATPDGRYAGEPLSKNLCATVGMDRNGLTALIHSVTQIDHSKFPNGSVLDVVLHPSAVQGEEGLNAFYGILQTYRKKGGFAMHGNVFNADDLKKAQANPEKYRNLQVRVCGWNAYFVRLSKAEQDAFIRQAENAG